MLKHPDEKFMQIAIDEAIRSASTGNYAVGAVVVRGDDILSVNHTCIHEFKDPTAHAELLAIREAAQKIDNRYLIDAYLYTTLEPCPMCTSAAIWAKMKGIVYGATTEDAKKVFLKSIGKTHDWRQIDIRTEYVVSKGTPTLEVSRNFMRNKCLELLSLNTK